MQDLCDLVSGLNGVQMFGVGHSAVVYLVEQLAGARHCRQYKFRYHDYEPLEDEVSLFSSFYSFFLIDFSFILD